LDTTGGTLRFRGTPVEKHWSREFNAPPDGLTIALTAA